MPLYTAVGFDYSNDSVLPVLRQIKKELTEEQQEMLGKRRLWTRFMDTITSKNHERELKEQIKREYKRMQSKYCIPYDISVLIGTKKEKSYIELVAPEEDDAIKKIKKYKEDIEKFFGININLDKLRLQII